MEQTARITRILFFILIFTSMSAWEIFLPRRQPEAPKLKRWRINLSLAVFSLVLERLITPMGTMGFAFLASSINYGIFNITSVSPWISWPLSILVLDLTVYFQHVLFHHVRFFKKIHGVHHTDTDLDITSGIRFHPLEIIMSLFLKGLAVFLLGPPPGAVLTFEIILNGASMFNHSNIFIPPEIDRVLKLLIVTPDMHRIHHSVIASERNSNYGFSFSFWDRLFANYTDYPSKGQRNMDLGLPSKEKVKVLSFSYLLLMPFRKG